MSCYREVAFEPWCKFSPASLKKCCLAFLDVVKSLPDDQMAMVNFTFDGGCDLRGTQAMKEGDNVFMLESGEEVVVQDAFIVNICSLSIALLSFEEKAQAHHSRFGIPVEKLIPSGFLGAVKRLDNLFEDVNNLCGAREVVNDKVVQILGGLP